MPSIFSRIMAGEIPCHRIAEDDHYFAFLDINPLAIGHTLVVPKKEVDYIFALDSDTYSGLWAFAQRVAVAVGTAVSCARVGVAVVGLEVPHVHIHLIPLQLGGSINFHDPKLKLTQEELAATAAVIRGKFV